MNHIVAMIPVRKGSVRLKDKNLTALGGSPLMTYAIRAAKGAGVFDHVVVNGDDMLFGSIAHTEGAGFYLRPESLGTSETAIDHVISDFMDHFPSEYVCIVNPPSPLQTAGEVAEVVNYFLRSDLDSLITVCPYFRHAMVRGEPVNFRLDAPLARTQDLSPVEVFVYSTMIWRCSTFRESMVARGHALFSGRFGTYPASLWSSLLVKTSADLEIVSAILEANCHRSAIAAES